MDIKKYTSTGWIIAAFIICFPVGIILLIVRQRNDISPFVGQTETTHIEKTTAKPGAKYRKTTTVFLVIGIALTVSAVGCVTQKAFKDLVPVLVVAITFILLYLFRAKTFESYRKYLDYFALHPVSSIQEVSMGIGVDEQSVKENVANLIHKKILDAYITDDGRIAMSGYDPNYTNDGQQKSEKKVIKCPSCGAQNEIYKGSSSKCKYCDVPLNW